MQEISPHLQCSNPSCVHPKEMKKIEGIFALTKVVKENNDIEFNPASGVPVVCYVCHKCGEMRLYSAKLLGEI